MMLVDSGTVSQASCFELILLLIPLTRFSSLTALPEGVRFQVELAFVTPGMKTCLR